MNKLISVIIPIYNSGKHLKKSIESVINQSYSNLEIILVNDGSKDNSINICKEYEAKDERIVFIDKKNEGVSKTRNLGIEISRGQYLMFVDSDDYIDEYYIQDMFNYLVGNEFDIVVSGMKLVNDKGFLKSKNLYLKKESQIYFEEIIEDIINTIYLCPCWKTLVRRDLII
jgi:glycosyltransferase involved in cell wall biosynthesis